MNEGIDVIHQRLLLTGRNSLVQFIDHRERFYWYCHYATHIYICMAWYDHVEDEYNNFHGKQVFMILNNNKQLHNSNYARRQRLDTSGAEVRVHHDPQQTMHCKFVVFYNQTLNWLWVWHGSYNMTLSGDRGIDHMTTSIDYDLANDFLEFYESLWEHSIPL